MEQKDFLKIKHEIDKAESDTKPIAGVVDNEIHVMGDVNNTKVEPKDYTIHYIIPEYLAKNIEEAKLRGDGYADLDIEYKDVFPTVRDNIKFTSALTQLLPFFRKLDENGGVENMTEDEFINDVFPMLHDDIVDAMYRVVKTALNIADELIGWATMGSVLLTVSQLAHDFPNAVNQADLFFGSSTVKA